MADENGRHLSPMAGNVLALLAVLVSIYSAIQSMPTGREFERLWKSIDEHHGLPGHAGVLAQVARNKEQITGVVTVQTDTSRRIDELKATLDMIQARQVTNQERESRMDENLRHVDMSVPPLSDRLATTEANVRALMASFETLRREHKQPTLREPER